MPPSSIGYWTSRVTQMKQRPVGAGGAFRLLWARCPPKREERDVECRCGCEAAATNLVIDRDAAAPPWRQRTPKGVSDRIPTLS